MSEVKTDSIELYQRNGMFSVQKQGENDAKSNVTAIAPAKRVKDIFGLTGQAVTLKRDEAGRALKTLAVMTVGALAQTPTVICTRIASRVAEWEKALGKMMNLVKAFAQRLAEQAKQSGQGQQLDGKDKAKVEAIMLTAKAKAQNLRESHAQRTAQRQIQFEMEQRREDAKARAEHGRAAQEAGVDLAAEEHRTRMGLKAEAVKHRMGIKRRAIENRLDVEAEREKSKLKSDAGDE